MDFSTPKRIIISRTDSIGDVVLSLPMAGWIKKKYPESTVIFIGRNYTVPVIKCSIYVDQVVSWDDYQTNDEQADCIQKLHADIILFAFPEKEVVAAAYKAKIPWRIATGRRKHTALACNKRLWWSRKKSDLHESQLNLKMLSFLGLKQLPTLESIPELYGFDNLLPLPKTFFKLLADDKVNVVLHPKSKGSAVEWGLDNFSKLIQILPQEKFKIFITGTAAERNLIQEDLPWQQNNLIDLTGKMSLDELISFLQQVDVVVAGSTGPIHIASALNTNTIGLYSPMRPMHPGRWMPIGNNANYLVASKHPEEGFLEIAPHEVMAMLNQISRNV